MVLGEGEKRRRGRWDSDVLAHLKRGGDGTKWYWAVGRVGKAWAGKKDEGERRESMRPETSFSSSFTFFLKDFQKKERLGGK